MDLKEDLEQIASLLSEDRGRLWYAGYRQAKRDIERHGEAYAIRVPDPHDNHEWAMGYINALSKKAHDKALKRLLTMIPGSGGSGPGVTAKWYDER